MISSNVIKSTVTDARSDNLRSLNNANKFEKLNCPAGYGSEMCKPSTAVKNKEASKTQGKTFQLSKATANQSRLISSSESMFSSIMSNKNIVKLQNMKYHDIGFIRHLQEDFILSFETRQKIKYESATMSPI